ncbi:MAG: hypothetical protein ACI8PZ_000111 [Myxococcota bacterium]|jgi:hypothetical protein
MSAPISLELRLDAREPDRVFVSVLLVPSDSGAPIGGVSVQLFTRSGQDLGNRLLLPIAGQLAQAMRSSVELRTLESIPPGSKVVATVWWPGGQVEATCPTDPGTELGSHMRGCKMISPADESELRHLNLAERERIAARFPWVDEPMLPAEEPTAYFEPTPEDDPDGFVDGIASQYDLDEESAEWLKELLTEEE